MADWILRPYTLSGDWADVGGGTTTGLSDESDSTYKLFDNQYQQGLATFSTAPIPFASNLVVKSVRVRARTALAASGAVNMRVIITTSGGRIIFAKGDGLPMAINWTSFQEQSTGRRTTVLSPADGDVLVILQPESRIEANQPKVSELYLDVETVYPPQVSVIVPSGGTYTATSRVPLRWSFFSQDAYAQVAYRYLIYRDDQYGAGGFVPGVTPPDYDSGVIYSAVKNSVMVARPNDTYRVYMTVAQSVNGVLQWQPWGATGSFATFTINITPPSAPSVTATAESSSARILVSVTGAGAANSILDVYELQRSFDSGVTWEAVRSDQVGGYLESVGGARVWYDYETANGQSVVYRARTITYDTIGNTLVGAWSSNSSAASWTSSSTWLKIATHSDLNRTIVVESLADEDFDVPFGVFQGLESGSAVVISGVRRDKPDSAFAVLVQTAAERDALLEILALGDPLLVHGSARVEDWYGASKWLQVSKVSMSRIIRGAWQADRVLTLPYTEVDRPDPSAFLVNFGVTTWQDIDDEFDTFTALNAAFTTYGEIRL